MKKNNNSIEIIDPKNQLNLFEYHNYFASLLKLYQKNKLSNVILLNGPKGIGKTTFAYHFINYLLSINEDNSYSISDYKINNENTSYKLLLNGTHPNFFLLQNDLSDEHIKIDQVRNLLKFLNKTTYYKNIKIVLIDNAEFLNKNASNAMLKALEEPNNNTFFFIINSNSSRLLSTIKSRCIEFRIFFNNSQKKSIIKNIIQQYPLDFKLEDFNNIFHFVSPGNLLRYLLIFYNTNIDINKDNLSCILYLVEKYKSKKDLELLSIASLFIELFYYELAKKNKDNLNYYFTNKSKILNKLNDVKKFNLDKKNLLISLQGMLSNEA